MKFIFFTKNLIKKIFIPNIIRSIPVKTVLNIITWHVSDKKRVITIVTDIINDNISRVL